MKFSFCVKWVLFGWPFLGTSYPWIMSPLVLSVDKAQLFYSDELKEKLDNHLSRLCKGDSVWWGGGSAWTSWPLRPLAMPKPCEILWGTSNQKDSLSRNSEAQLVLGAVHRRRALCYYKGLTYLGLERQQCVLCLYASFCSLFHITFFKPKNSLFESTFQPVTLASLLPALVVYVCVWFPGWWLKYLILESQHLGIVPHPPCLKSWQTRGHLGHGYIMEITANVINICKLVRLAHRMKH